MPDEQSVTVSILIEDYKDLNTNKKVRISFEKDMIVSEGLLKIAQKSMSLQLEKDITKYDLIILNTGERMTSDKKFG